MSGIDARQTTAATAISVRIAEGFRRHLHYLFERTSANASTHEKFHCLALAVRDELVDRRMASGHRDADLESGPGSASASTESARQVLASPATRDLPSAPSELAIVALEYPLGPQLGEHLCNLAVLEPLRVQFAKEGIDLAGLIDAEPETRIAGGDCGGSLLCLLDSAARRGIDVVAHGLRYELGGLEQRIVGGWPVEKPNPWIRCGTPWEMSRPSEAQVVRLFGFVEDRFDETGRYRPHWRGARTVIGIPHDILLSTHSGPAVHRLRLWSARAGDDFDSTALARGGIVEAIRERSLSETITKAPQPDEPTDAAKEARLVQQYFLAACAMGDLMRRRDAVGGSAAAQRLFATIHLHGDSTALCVCELMRLLVDQRGLEWEAAWEITTGALRFSCQALRPSGLEPWRVSLFSLVLPRHLQIIYEINRRFLDDMATRRPGQWEHLARASLIQESPVRAVRSAHLAVVGSRRVCGTSAFHEQRMRERDWPEVAEQDDRRFTYVVAMPSVRRWLANSHPELCQAIAARIGGAWLRDPAELGELERFATDPAFGQEVRAATLARKLALARRLHGEMSVSIDPAWMFDVHVSSFAPGSRALLLALHAIERAERIRAGQPTIPRVMLVAGQAACTDRRAKLFIKLFHDLADRMSNDPVVSQRLKLVFLPNFGARAAQRLLPAADLFQSLESAGEATCQESAWVVAMCGGLTLATEGASSLDLRRLLGESNAFRFGLTQAQVAARRTGYDSWKLYSASERNQRLLGELVDDTISRDAPGRYRELFDCLTREGDPHMLLADIDSYLAVQEQIDARWMDAKGWTESAIRSITRVGSQSSDASLEQYIARVWS